MKRRLHEALYGSGTRLAKNGSIMNEIGTILGIIAIVAVALLDIIVRLVVAPDRRDKYVESLLDSMTEVEPVDQVSRAPHASAALDDSLAESLFRHFEQSATSRQVLAALTATTGGMPESEVVSAVNRELTHQRKRKLPAAVVRRVVMILMGADLAALRQGRLELTIAGKSLHALLQVRSIEAEPTPAFVSP
jgi:hypothetical protein